MQLSNILREGGRSHYQPSTIKYPAIAGTIALSTIDYQISCDRGDDRTINS